MTQADDDFLTRPESSLQKRSKLLKWCSKIVYGMSLLGLLTGCQSLQPRDEAQYAPTLPTPVAPPPVAATGSIYQPSTARPLWEDVKAQHVGDLLTVVLTESTAASKSANTTTTKETTIDTGMPIVFGGPVPRAGRELLNNEIESGTEFAGSGDSNQSNSLQGTITVTVADVLPNGNLLVRGQKKVWLNQGEEFVQIAGIVRPEDIRADNTVLSTRVANAHITYAGRGAVADVNAQGWLTRFFNSVFWPF